MKYPKISIITPNYNGDAYLEATIMSVLNQNYPNLEYIVIDGGSTDNSVEIIKKYEAQLTYWISEKDDGLYSALQKGFDKSTGTIMAWLNSDDLYHPKALFTVAEIFNNFPEINWLTGSHSHFDEKGRTVSVSTSKHFTKYDFYSKNYKWIQQESTFWKRDLWQIVGNHLNTDLKYAGDFELWLRFFRFERLYVTTALIGGFRMRSHNQLSLEFIDDYIAEVEDLIESEPISVSDQKIIRKYRYIKKLANLFFNLRLDRTKRLAKDYENTYMPRTPAIKFNRNTQKFEIND